MRISYVLGYLEACYGGPPYSAISVAKYMKDSGCDISFWATGNDENENLTYIKEMDIKAYLFDVSFPKRWFRSRNLYKSLSSKALSFDLFHMHGMWNYPVYAGSSVAAKYDVPYIISPRGALQTWAIRRSGVKKSLYSMLLLKKMLGRAACLHALTQAEAECFRSTGYEGPITVIANGVDVPDSGLLPDVTEAEEIWPSLQGRRVLLFMSRLSPEKGLDQLLPAFADIVSRGSYDDVVLVIAGPNHRGYQAKVKSMIDNLGLSSKILLTGMVEGNEKKALLSRADLYVLPSHSEGFSISLLENLAIGNPVIITPACNFPQVVKSKAGICVGSDSADLSQALRIMFDLSDDQRRDMGNRAKKLVLENYTWDAIAQQYLIVYDCILKGKEIPLYPGKIVQKDSLEYCQNA